MAVPERGLSDTVTFTVRPGAPSFVQLVPRDTALAIGSSVTIGGGVRDRFGNVRPDPVTFTVVAEPVGAATVTAAGVVTAVLPGRAAVAGRAGAAVDAAVVSVVPPGTIAAWFVSTGHWIQVNTDGSGRRNLTTDPIVPSADNEPSWSADGRELLFVSGGLPTILSVADGGITRLLPTASGSWCAPNDSSWSVSRGRRSG